MPMVEISCKTGGCPEDAKIKGFCTTHYHRQWRLGSATAPLKRNSPLASVAERFWSFAPRLSSEECWPWGGMLGKAGSYGVLTVAKKKLYAHRVAYELLVGPIPSGLTLDHTCHTQDESCAGGPSCPHRRCVNPAHLEPVTGRVNRLRGRSPAAQNALKTHCKHGHPFDDANTYRNLSGGRTCRACTAESQRRYQERKQRKSMNGD